ncbi:MAG: hydantoinase/oxoprolinase family protein, partial [Pseudomonadota bacterium]|nr:hydantoinase/oxoprolinase family protein [Pseudomonadota bacterium]
RYEFQVWDLEIPLPAASFDGPADITALVEAFHIAHERVFAVRDNDSVVEFVNWKARLTKVLENPPHGVTRLQTAELQPDGLRMAYFGEVGRVETPIYKNPRLGQVARIDGPAIIEMPMTTLVVYPGMTASTTRLGNFLLTSQPHQSVRKAANA